MSWWVVWLSSNDGTFHHCHGYDEVTARKVAGLLVETKGIRRVGDDKLIQNLSILANTVAAGEEIYRDSTVENPFHCAIQAWTLQAKRYQKVIKAAQKIWESNQLVQGEKIE